MADFYDMALPLFSDTRKNETRYFFLIFLLLGTLIAGSIFMVYLGQFREFQTMVTREKSMDLETQRELVSLRFEEMVSDIHFLSQLASLTRALDGSGDISDVENDFSSFSRAKSRYSQIRFLNTDGWEVVRINNSGTAPELVRTDDLQDKSNRYYFIEAAKLKVNEVYVSELDLNVEQGVLELPFSPMIRLVAPVYRDSDLKGVVVLNYRAVSLLDELEILGKRNLGYLTLLNKDGYYLISRNNENEWGFQVDERRNARFSILHPELWSSVSQQLSFQQESSNQIIASTLIFPLKGLIDGYEDYYWIAMNTVPKEQLIKNTYKLSIRLFVLGVFLVLLSTIPSWAITRYLVRKKEQRRELYVSANYDKLTILPNRSLLLDRLQQSVFRSRRYKREGALLFIDLDGFKSVNDNYGHETGDLLLKLVGRRLIENVRRSDTAARYGGDEFVVLIPEEHGVEEAEILARKLLFALSEPYLLPGYRLEIGASIGIRTFTGEVDETPDIIIRDADTAMYQTKNSGKGGYTVFG